MIDDVTLRRFARIYVGIAEYDDLWHNEIKQDPALQDAVKRDIAGIRSKARRAYMRAWHKKLITIVNRRNEPVDFDFLGSEAPA